MNFQNYKTIFASLLASFGFAVAIMSSSAASAATLSFTLDDTQGSDSMVTDVVITDIAGGVNMAFTINDSSRVPANEGDIIAVFFDMVSPFTYANLSIANSGPVTDSAGNTDKIGAGKIGKVFDVGVAIGSKGAGSGDIYADFNFDVLGTDLTISAFFGQEFAARGQSLGLGAEGSAKQFGTAGSLPDGPGDVTTPVPLPAAGWMLLAGLGVLGAMRRRKTVA